MSVAVVDKRVANLVVDHSDHHSDSLAHASLAKVPCKRHCQNLNLVCRSIRRADHLTNPEVARNPGLVDNL
jgi:hypothetical protein